MIVAVPADVDEASEHLLTVYGKRTRGMFRECLRNGLVPFIVLDAEKTEYYRAIRTFEDDGGARFVRFAEHMAQLYLEEFSSLIPQNLLLPPLEEYIKHPSFDEGDLSFFE